MVTFTKPPRVRASDLRPVWHVMDAEGKILGRLASEIATLLQGKHKPIYVSHLNTGDFVIVVNAEKIRVTGKKLEQKVYYRHSGYHGGLKEQTLSELMSRKPTRAIRQAVKGMLPKNIMGRRMLARLKLYAGASHPHEAQVNARPKTSESRPGAEVPDEAEVKEATRASKAEAAPKRRARAKTEQTAAEAPGRAETEETTGASKPEPAPKRRTRAKKSQPSAEIADAPELGESPEASKPESTKRRTRARKPKRAGESSGEAGDEQAEPSKGPETEDA